MTLIAPGSLPCAAVSTAVTVTLLWTSWLMTRALGGVGSPSLMMTMCLVIASLTALSPFMAIWSEGSKSGMSPGVMRSTARSMLLRPDPIGRRVNSQAS